MIDNPLENQVMEEYNSSYINEKYEEHCADRAKELAEINNLLPDYYEPTDDEAMSSFGTKWHDGL